MCGIRHRLLRSPAGGPSINTDWRDCGEHQLQADREAPLPDGFPTYTPVGEIEVKRYPAYRKAETTGGVAFWTLFQHIKTAGISMTAPVEMTYEKDGPPVGRERVNGVPVRRQ